MGSASFMHCFKPGHGPANVPTELVLTENSNSKKKKNQFSGYLPNLVLDSGADTLTYAHNKFTESK